MATTGIVMNHTVIPKLKNIKRRQLETCIAIFLTLAVSACNNSSSGSLDVEPEPNAKFPSATDDSGPEGLIVTGFDSNNADATTIWLVESNFPRFFAPIGDATVDLLRYENDFPVSLLVEMFTEEMDTCVVINGPLIATEGFEGYPGKPPYTVSGGDRITINTPSGSWFTLDKTVWGLENILYTTNNKLPDERLPSGSTLSIPGEEFPAVSAHPLFDAAKPVRMLPNAELSIASDSVYSWIPGSGKTQMEISLFSNNLDGANAILEVRCIVRDDGSFTMPDNVVEFVSTTPDRLEARYTRIYSRLDFVDSIVFSQRNANAE